MRVRQHENVVKVQKALLKVWKVSEDNEVDVDLDQPIMFAERVKIMRKNYQADETPKVFGAGIHNWSKSNSRKIYEKLLAFDTFEDFEPWELDYRIEAASYDAFKYEV